MQFLERNQFIRRRSFTGRAFVHLSARLAPDCARRLRCPAPLVTAPLGRAPPFRNRVYDCIDRCAARANNYWSVTGRGRSASVACSYRAISISGPIVRRRGGTCDTRICGSTNSGSSDRSSCCRAAIAPSWPRPSETRKWLRRLDTEHSRWFGRLPHSRPRQLKFNLPVASVIDRLAAMSFIVLPLPPRRAAVAGIRAYRKWRGAAPLRGR